MRFSSSQMLNVHPSTPALSSLAGRCLAIAILGAGCGPRQPPWEDDGGGARGLSCDGGPRADVPSVDATFDPMRPCHLIGCNDGVFVRLAVVDNSVGAFRVEALVDGRPLRFRCGPDDQRWTVEYRCYSEDVFEISATPGCIDLSVVRESDGASFHGRVVPDYYISQPNGPLCRPVCRRADATITLRP